MLRREEWLDLARKVDWDYSYVRAEDVFPEVASGTPWLPHSAWRDWDEPYRTTYREYVSNQYEKDRSVYSVLDALGKFEDFERVAGPWVNGLKLHAATLPLAEFSAVVGQLRAARFGRDSAWRTAALFGALDEFRHTQIPLVLMHRLLHWDGQFDWTHKFYHSDQWIAVAARHLVDELILAANPIEFAIGTNFVFETGFTNLQFVGLAALAHQAGDRMFEKMVTSIQSDEARHAQIGGPVLRKIVEHDPEYAQYLLDKWFWRSWLLFSIVTGFAMDYFTPVDKRPSSFKEFMQEWIADQFLRSVDAYGLKKPWYWDIFLEAIDTYHHMVYASAYTYRATVWFDFVVPGPKERAWLRRKYPKYWDQIEPVWENIDERWCKADVGNDFAVHGTAIVGFCELCQLTLSNGTPRHNTATTLSHDGRKHIFCSEPCRWIFERELERYEGHKGIVKRVLAGEAPGNLMEMVRRYFGLGFDTWGKDMYGGDYAWLRSARMARRAEPSGGAP